MKAFLTFLVLPAISIIAQAQTLMVSGENISYYFPANDNLMPFENGNSVKIGEKTFLLSDFPLMKVQTESPVEENQVLISYSNSGATAAIHGSVAQYVDIIIADGHVSIDQSSEVSESSCGEITYILKGASCDGSFTLSGSYKASIELTGLSLTNPSGAAIDIQNGKRISLSAKSGTENILVDGSGSQKAALYCKGHLELKGKGNLTVTGNQGHAISAKEYITVKNLSITVPGAKKDGINCNQYFAMESGNINISGVGDDGIQVSFKDDADREPEDTGSFSMSGGKIEISISKGEASKGIKVDGDINIINGEINIDSSCIGMWDSVKLKTKASACLGADGNCTIGGGNIILTASGSGGKGISCDGVFTSDGGIISITTSGGMLVYSNGNLNHNYTGSSDFIASDNKSSAKGIKADSGVIINGGAITVHTSSNNAEGIESKTSLEINGGETYIKAYDDGINSSKDLTISGGKVTVMSSAGDAIDSNANLYITGGEVMALGAGGAEQGLDAADESGCYVYITGGKVLSFGGRSAPVSQTAGSQALLSVSGSVTAGSDIIVSNSSDELAAFTIPDEYVSSSSGGRPAPGGGWGPGGGVGGSQLLISCPGLVSGNTYTVKNGTSTSSATAATTSN